jgi:hypothetical protein
MTSLSTSRVDPKALVDVMGSAWNRNLDRHDAALLKLRELESRFRALEVPDTRYLVRLRRRIPRRVDAGGGEFVTLVHYAWERIGHTESGGRYVLEQPDSGPPGDMYRRPAFNLAELHLLDEQHAGLLVKTTGIAELAPTVELWTIPTRDGEPMHVFYHPLPETFPVRLYRQGNESANGNKDQPATQTYLIRTLDGFNLAGSDDAPLTPLRRRQRVGRIDPPEPGDVGIGVWDAEARKIRLWDANEVPAVTVC